MSDRRLFELAEAAGLSIDWIDADNKEQRVSPEVLRGVLAELGLPADSDDAIADSLHRLDATIGGGTLPPLLTVDRNDRLDLSRFFAPGAPFSLQLEQGERLDGHLDDAAHLRAPDAIGYHQLSIGDSSLCLAVAPHACPTVTERAGPGAWGLTVQLYGLRRPGDGGLGDTEALEQLARNAATHGAHALGISPVHAMFNAYPDQYSPYSPSSRLFYNALHCSPGSILGERPLRQAIERCGIGAELERLERLDLVDWPAVSASRQCLLRTLYEDFRTGGNAQQADFDSFRAAGGEMLENHCRFEVLHDHFRSPGGLPQHWRGWPEDYRDPTSEAVRRFAEEHADDVSFYAFSQWLMARGLERAQQAARSAGMPIGLIADLAVGADGGGSQAWSRQSELLASLSVGAPPDIMNRDGQNWGISAFSPWGLKQHGFRAFIEMLRANLAHAGGMRIDHVLGLKRLWVMPAGADPKQGVYLDFPFDDMLRLLCLEAARHDAVILGEDLGTIPPGLRETLARRGILGMRVLLFEHHNGEFSAPQHWSAQALATTTTHDIPTIAGWWQGKDIDWRIRVGQSREDDRERHWNERQHERWGLNRALHADAGGHGEAPSLLDPADAVDASARFLGHSPAPLVLLPVEDALGLDEQPNMPGIIHTHPNWQRRYPGEAATLLDGPVSSRRLAGLAEARQRARRSSHP